MFDPDLEINNAVELAVDHAFRGKITINMYEYLKSLKATRGDAERFLESPTAKNVNLLIYDLDDYLEGGSDSEHKATQRAYGHLGKPEARKIRNFLDKHYHRRREIYMTNDQEGGKDLAPLNNEDQPRMNRGVELMMRNKNRRREEALAGNPNLSGFNFD